MSVGLAPVRAVLDNGAVILIKSSRVTPAVTIHASVHAGSVFDPPQWAGLAHFVSRTIDRGTLGWSASQIADALDNRGVSLAIAINRHVMTFVCTCLAEDAPTILAVLADILVNPSFPADEVDMRRGEIATLIRQDEDSPATMASEGLLRLLYGPGHPYGRRPRGTVEALEGLPRQAIVDFHLERFKPAALSLALVGDVDPQRGIDLAAAAFRDWPAQPIAPPVFPPIPPVTRRRTHVEPMMAKSQADIAYGFVSIERGDPRYYACWLMNNILGQYALGGRLGDSIRERQGMAYYAMSTLDANIVPGPLVVRAGVNPVNVDRAIRSIDRELTAMATEGPTEREVTESRQYLVGSMPRNLETNLGIANFLQTAEFFGLGLDYDVRLPVLLGAVTREDVHAAARALLDPERAALVVAGPYDGTPP